MSNQKTKSNHLYLVRIPDADEAKRLYEASEKYYEHQKYDSAVMAGEMAFGTIESGGYEESNVDIAYELSNMISAQRMIQMNSRVFSTSSEVMQQLAYLVQ